MMLSEQVQATHTYIFISFALFIDSLYKNHVRSTQKFT